MGLAGEPWPGAIGESIPHTLPVGRAVSRLNSWTRERRVLLVGEAGDSRSPSGKRALIRADAVRRGWLFTSIPAPGHLLGGDGRHEQSETDKH